MKIELSPIHRRLRTLAFAATIFFLVSPSKIALARGGHGGGHAAMGHGIGHSPVARNGSSSGRMGGGSPVGQVGHGSSVQGNAGRSFAAHQPASRRGRGGRHSTTSGHHSGRRISSAPGAAGRPLARASSQHPARFSRNHATHHHRGHDHHAFFAFWPTFYDPFFYGYGSYYYYDPYPCDPSNDPDCVSYYTRHYYPYARGPRPPYSFEPSVGPVGGATGSDY